jgi:hypothetical protein
MVKFGQALLFTWGKCNIYYYSYYKESDPDLSIQVMDRIIQVQHPSDCHLCFSPGDIQPGFDADSKEDRS